MQCFSPGHVIAVSLHSSLHPSPKYVCRASQALELCRAIHCAAVGCWLLFQRGLGLPGNPRGRRRLVGLAASEAPEVFFNRFRRGGRDLENHHTNGQS